MGFAVKKNGQRDIRSRDLREKGRAQIIRSLSVFTTDLTTRLIAKTDWFKVHVLTHFSTHVEVSPHFEMCVLAAVP